MSPPPRTGFTLIELLIVMAIIALLASIALPRYFQSVEHAREAVLTENLRTVREAIDKFYGDTGRYPESLDEMVEKRYLRSLPVDPITESAATWVVIRPQGEAKGNVYDLKSGAPGATHDGKAFETL